MFWENFVELCSQNGTSPNAVAAQLGKSSGSVTAWKNGAVPRETTLKKIADYFSVTVDRLIYDQKEKAADPEVSGLTPEQLEVIRLFDSADPVRRQIALDILRAAEAADKAGDTP